MQTAASSQDWLRRRDSSTVTLDPSRPLDSPTRQGPSSDIRRLHKLMAPDCSSIITRSIMQAARNSASAPPISERTLSSQESRPLPISLPQSTHPESRWSTIVSALCHVPTLGLPVVYRRWVSEYLGHMEASYPEIDFRGLANRNAWVMSTVFLRYVTRSWDRISSSKAGDSSKGSLSDGSGSLD